MIIQSQIQELVHQRLLGSRIEIQDVVDQLLLLAGQAGELRCTLAGEQNLRFELRGEDPFMLELDRARTKLRALCARLGVLCNETGRIEVSLYGGEGVIEKPLSAENHLKPTRWAVRFKNTPDEQEFVIAAL